MGTCVELQFWKDEYNETEDYARASAQLRDVGTRQHCAVLQASSSPVTVSLLFTMPAWTEGPCSPGLDCGALPGAWEVGTLSQVWRGRAASPGPPRIEEHRA